MNSSPSDSLEIATPNLVARIPAGPADPFFQRLVEQAEKTFKASKSDATRLAYRHDWKEFRTWCERHGFISLPASAEAVILYATDLTKNHKRLLATVRRRLAAVSQMHLGNGYESPTCSWETKKFMAGLRRQLGVAPRRRKKALKIDELKKILAQLPDTMLGRRDRAILLLGFAGAFRRSELVALDVENLEESPEGLIVKICYSKTDQEGKGRDVGVPQGQEQASCPIWAIEQWRSKAKIEKGALFRRVNRHGQVLKDRLSAQAVGMIVKRYVAWLGYDVEDFGGHSLRSGLATAAAKAGKSERSIMRQTGHRSLSTVRRYIDAGTVFEDNAAKNLGL